MTTLTFVPSNTPNVWILKRGRVSTDIRLRHMPRAKCWRLYHHKQEQNARGQWRDRGSVILLVLPYDTAEADAKAIAINHLTVTE